MEIWKINKDKLFRQPFKTTLNEEPVTDFTDPSLPPLNWMILEELRKDDGARWVVFSESEGLEIHRIGSIFITPERHEGNALFIHAVLSPVREQYRKGFSVMYIDANDPKLVIPTEGNWRLAIYISE